MAVMAVKWTGLAAMQKKYAHMGPRAKNFLKPFSWMADDVNKEVAKQFRSQGRHFGKAWRQLDPAYAERKKKKRRMGGINVWSGKLRMGVTKHSGRYGYRIIQPLRLELGSSRLYSSWVQKARPFYDITKRMRVRYMKWGKSWILLGRKRG